MLRRVAGGSGGFDRIKIGAQIVTRNAKLALDLKHQLSRKFATIGKPGLDRRLPTTDQLSESDLTARRPNGKSESCGGGVLKGHANQIPLKRYGVNRFTGVYFYRQCGMFEK